jgi:hypothetical protein
MVISHGKDLGSNMLSRNGQDMDLDSFRPDLPILATIEDISDFNHSGIQEYHSLIRPAKPGDLLTLPDNMEKYSFSHKIMVCNQMMD